MIDEDILALFTFKMDSSKQKLDERWLLFQKLDRLKKYLLNYIFTSVPCPTKHVEEDCDVIIGSRWKLQKQLGLGTFGAVFKAEDIVTKTEVAIKLEAQSARFQLLRLENYIYMQLQRAYGTDNGFAHVHDFCEFNGWNCMAMSLLGRNLDRFRKSQGGRISLGLSLWIGLNTQRLLEKMHAIGYVHGDVKPENILLGPNDSMNIYLVDFGLSTRYIDIEGRHYENNKEHGGRGTLRFMSVRCHEGRRVNRRDDLESLAYMMIFLFRGELPWDEELYWKEDVKERVRRKKRKWIRNAQLTDMGVEMKVYLECVQGLSFNQKPNYKKLEDLLLHGIQRSSRTVQLRIGCAQTKT